MAEVVYVLCSITSIVCAALLFRAYRGSGHRLLFLSALCFTGLAVNNILLLVDLLIGQAADLRLLRTGIATGSLYLLVQGLVGDSR